MASRRYVSTNEKVLIAGLWRLKHMSAWKIARIVGRSYKTVYNYRNYEPPATRSTTRTAPRPATREAATELPAVDEVLIQSMFKDFVDLGWYEYDESQVFTFIRNRYWDRYGRAISKWPKYHGWTKADIIKDLMALLLYKYTSSVRQKP